MPASLRDVRVVSPAVAGTDPVVQFTAVLDATREALKSAGLGVDDIGLFKVYESFAGVLLIAQGDFGIPGRQAQHQRRLHRHRAPALLNRRGCSLTCPASWNARSRATACRPSAAPPAPQLSNARREHLS